MSSYEIAPYDVPIGLATDIISVILLSVAVLTCSIVVLAIYKLDNKNKLRSRILIGLFVSHLWAGLVFLVPLIASLSGHPPKTGSFACEASAYLVESATWTQYLFAIAVAAVSYFILLHPLSNITLTLERYWYCIILAVYVLAWTVAGIQASLYRAVYIGGFCWNGSTRDDFNEILNFAPRAVVFLMILALYGRIHLFLRKRRHRHHSRTANTNAIMPLRSLPSANEHNDQPWEAMHLSGLSQMAMMDDDPVLFQAYDAEPRILVTTEKISDGRPSPDSSSTLAPSDASSADSKTVRSASLVLAPSKDTDEPVLPPISLSEIVVSDSFGSSGSESPSQTDTIVSMPSTISSDSSGLTLAPRPPRIHQHRNPYSTGHWHTPYHPKPLAKKRSKHEHFETLHDLLTRKAAALFLLFPLTYFVLAFISGARLIDDYVQPTDPSLAMRAISRWALFMQGTLDALTYGVFALHVKKSVGKEIMQRWPWLAARGQRDGGASDV